MLRGDLDWIVMKALEKDRTRRYETANGLATNLKRHLSNEPIVARPPSAAYRLRKLVRRNKLAFAAAGAIAVALVGGVAIALAALAKERSANRLAEQRMVAALQRVESFLTNDLPAVRRLVGSTKATESMLRNTLAFMSALAPKADDNPEFLLASAKVHASLAWLQVSRWGASLGDPEAALASASNAWTVLRSIPTGALPRARVQEMTCRAEAATGVALEALGREDEALAHFERMLTLATELDQQLPRTGDCRWSSDAHMRLGAYFMANGKWEQLREHNDHLLRDPYLLTNTASEDLRRLNFTGGALWCRAITADGMLRSPDGRLFAYPGVKWVTVDGLIEPRFELRIAGIDGAEPRVLCRDKEVLLLLIHQWSPDGKYVAATVFQKDRTCQLVLVSAAEGSVRILKTQVLKTLNWSFQWHRMSFSPDGRFAVYDLLLREAGTLATSSPSQ